MTSILLVIAVFLLVVICLGQLRYILCSHSINAIRAEFPQLPEQMISDLLAVFQPWSLVEILRQIAETNLAYFRLPDTRLEEREWHTLNDDNDVVAALQTLTEHGFHPLFCDNGCGEDYVLCLGIRREYPSLRSLFKTAI